MKDSFWEKNRGSAERRGPRELMSTYRRPCSQEDPHCNDYRSIKMNALTHGSLRYGNLMPEYSLLSGKPKGTRFIVSQPVEHRAFGCE